ncbi:MAG: hypothetical protein AAI978_00830 [Candidatus Hodgkinia cicadicola]
MKIKLIARSVASAQAALGLRITADDEQCIVLSKCALKAFEIWSKIVLTWWCNAPAQLVAYAIATVLLTLGFRVELATMLLVLMADVIFTALFYITYVLVITCKCRFRLRLLAAAPATTPLAWYVIHDIVIPPICHFGSGSIAPKVLTRKQWPFPFLSWLAPRLRKPKWATF